MVNYLKVENLAVVKKAELSFSPTLNVLTGETGAGKSILIDAIQLLMQKRIPSHIVRGGERLVVETLFSRGDEEFVLKREIENSRSVAFINGEVATFQQLKELATSLLNIYGQKDHVFLLHIANHQAFLDAYAGHSEQLARLAEKHRLIRKLQQEHRDLSEKSSQIQFRGEELAFQIQEIEKLDMKKGDEAQLQEHLKILASAETIMQKADVLIQELHQNEQQSVYRLLAQNRQNVEYLRSLFPDFSGYADELERMYKLVPEISNYLTALVGKLEFDENELNRLEQLLQRVEKLKNKYKLSLDQILDQYEEKKKELLELSNITFAVQEKEKEIAKSLDEYRLINSSLRQSREEASTRLSRLVEQELGRLEMKKARFQVQMEAREPDMDNVDEKGTDRIEFFFSSNPGQMPGPLAQVASGGELSRLMLVLKSLGRGEKESTYIFDEIDAGIGGKTAEFVGEKLRQIAEENQVICISHLPQIASFADRHFLITKEFKNDQTFSTARALDLEERTTEIARLMAGSSINEDVIKAAAGLLRKNGR